MGIWNGGGTCIDDKLRFLYREVVEQVRKGNYKGSDRAAEYVISQGGELVTLMLEGVSIDSKGVLRPTLPFVVHPTLQRMVDYFLWRLILNADDGVEVHPSLMRENIVRVQFPTYPVTAHEERIETGMGYGYRIPEELSNLTNLRRLGLRLMAQRGFPACLKRLGSLEYLDLSHNALVDRIPEWFYDLQNMRYLDLTHCSVGEISPSIARMRNMRVLKLTGNRLSGLPTELFELEGLIRLDLDQTFVDFACGHDRLPNLRHLDLSDNNYGETTRGLQLPDGLTHLDLGGNPLRKAPACLSRLTGLKSLRLRGCGLYEVPQAVLFMSGLRRLDISDNKIRHLPSGLNGLSELRNVDFEQRCLMAPEYIPGVHGKGLKGWGRLLEDHLHVYGRPLRDGADTLMDPFHYFQRWRSFEYWSDQVVILRFRHRKNLFRSYPHMRGFFGLDRGPARLMSGVKRVLEEGLERFTDAFLSRYRLVEGVFYEMPGLFWPFELKRESMHAVAVALLGRMDESAVSARFGEGGIRRIFDKVDGRFGFKGMLFPSLEEMSIVCVSGKVPEWVFAQPALRRLTVHGADEEEVDRILSMGRFEHLSFLESAFANMFCARGVRKLRSLRLESSHFDPNLLVLDMPDLEVLSLSLEGRPEVIAIKACPRLKRLHVSGSMGADLFVRGCPSLQAVRLRDVGTVDLEELFVGSPALKTISIRNCRVAGISEEVSGLKGLHTLELDLCGIEAIPASILAMGSLRILRVRNTNGVFKRKAGEPMPVVLGDVPKGLFSMGLFELDLDLPDELHRRLLADPGARDFNPFHRSGQL